MTDEENGQDVLENVLADLERVEALLERAEVTHVAAVNRLRLYRDRYENEGESHPMPPGERCFQQGPGNKTTYSGPPEEQDDDE